MGGHLTRPPTFIQRWPESWGQIIRLVQERRGSKGRSAQLVGVAQPIVRCGEIGGIGRRREIAERGMGATLVEIGDPSGDRHTGMVQVEEQRLVE